MIRAKIKAVAPYVVGFLIWLLTDNALRTMQQRYDAACGRLEARGLLGVCSGGDEFGILAITCIVASVAVGYALRRFFIWSAKDIEQAQIILNSKALDQN